MLKKAGVTLFLLLSCLAAQAQVPNFNTPYPLLPLSQFFPNEREALSYEQVKQQYQSYRDITLRLSSLERQLEREDNPRRWVKNKANWLTLRNRHYLTLLALQSWGAGTTEPPQELLALFQTHYGGIEVWWELSKTLISHSDKGWLILEYHKPTATLHTYIAPTAQHLSFGGQALWALNINPAAYRYDYPGDPLSYFEAWKKNCNWERLSQELRSHNLL